MMTIEQHWERLKRKLDATYQPPPAVPTLPYMEPLELWHHVMGVHADPWQETVLKSEDPRICLNCCRQSGKSSVVAVKALHIGLYQPNSLILLLSRSLRQSGELARKVFDSYESTGRAKVPADSLTKQTLELSNGSRIIALPGGDEGAIRGFSGVHALILDEAARIPDQLYVAVRPMVAVSGGSMMLLSTPYGKRGFFYRVFSESQNWLKIQITADQCPRLSPEFLAEERRELGPRWFSQEYMAAFVEAVGQLFDDAAIDAAFMKDIQPLFGQFDNLDGLLSSIRPLFEEPERCATSPA